MQIRAIRESAINYIGYVFIFSGETVRPAKNIINIIHNTIFINIRTETLFIIRYL